MVAGANDYQGDYNAFYATPTRGNTWYGSVNPNPSNPFAYNLTQSDPVLRPRRRRLQPGDCVRVG